MLQVSNETLASLSIFKKNCSACFSNVMALFKAVVLALIFLTKLRFPPGVSSAIALKDRYRNICIAELNRLAGYATGYVPILIQRRARIYIYL